MEVPIQPARGQVPGMNRPNASEKIGSFSGRLAFFAVFVLFFVCFVWLYLEISYICKR